MRNIQKKIARKRKVDLDLSQKELQNRFQIFYIIRLLWKYHNHQVDDLYAALGLNRTLYTKILHLDAVDLLDRKATLEAVTNVSFRYWDGEKACGVFLKSWNLQEQNGMWEKLISLRKQQGQHKSAELIQTERTIKEKILTAIREDNLQQETEVFRRLAYFATYRQKRPEKNAEEMLLQIERDIQQIHLNTIKSVQTQRLNTHMEIVCKYLERLQAALVVERWKD